MHDQRKPLMHGCIAVSVGPRYSKGMATDGRKIREIRRRFGLNQGQVAKELGVTQGTISRWEKGKQEPGYDALIKLARLVGIDDPIAFAFDNDEHPYERDDWRAGVRVVGGSNVRKWVESPYWEEQFQFSINIPLLPDWTGKDIIGFYVDDDLADYYFKKGSVVFCARFDENKIEPTPGDLIVFAEKGEGGLLSVGVREYDDFSKYDMPVTDRVVLSTPSHQQEGWDLELSARRIKRAATSGSLFDMGFIGVIVAAFNIIAPTRIPPSNSSSDMAPPAPPEVKRIRRGPPKPAQLKDGGSK